MRIDDLEVIHTKASQFDHNRRASIWPLHHVVADSAGELGVVVSEIGAALQPLSVKLRQAAQAVGDVLGDGGQAADELIHSAADISPGDGLSRCTRAIAENGIDMFFPQLVEFWMASPGNVMSRTEHTQRQ